MKLLFRKYVDVVVYDPDGTPEGLYEQLRAICEKKGLGNPEEFQVIGSADIPDIPPETLKSSSLEFEKFSGTHVLASMQYRGENFTALCRKKEEGDRVTLVPVALVLTHAQKKRLRDVEGNAPVPIRSEGEGNGKPKT
jgi:hypothetical protein